MQILGLCSLLSYKFNVRSCGIYYHVCFSNLFYLMHQILRLIGFDSIPMFFEYWIYTTFHLYVKEILGRKGELSFFSYFFCLFSVCSLWSFSFIMHIDSLILSFPCLTHLNLLVKILQFDTKCPDIIPSRKSNNLNNRSLICQKKKHLLLKQNKLVST